MIINHEKKWIYVGPPKTSSTTLSYLLTDGEYQNQKWGKKLAPNFYGVSEGGQHVGPGELYNDYFIFITTRNPFERIVSLWGHWKYGKNMENSKIDKTNIELKDFLEIVLSIQSGADNHLGGPDFFNLNMHEWTKYNTFIKIENLLEDLLNLKLHQHEFKIPNCNKNLLMREKVSQSWQELHTPETIELTKKWAKKDFDKFEYSDKL